MIGAICQKVMVKTMFEIYDKRSGDVVGKTVKSREAARRSVDRRDNAYGAYRYGYRAIGSTRAEY